ncbi:MAG: hypothetical protein M3040_03605 [Bacteroidota bacterium]|nr:hypothetical protein [Bacteroidota bacterium]
MESNVLSWNVALEKGYEPRLYPYAIEYVPLGEYEAVLDFKVWAKKAMGICCYFTQKDTGKKFQLTVYRRQKDEQYMLDENGIDFKGCPVNTDYLITVNLNRKQKAAFKGAASCNQ